MCSCRFPFRADRQIDSVTPANDCSSVTRFPRLSCPLICTQAHIRSIKGEQQIGADIALISISLFCQIFCSIISGCDIYDGVKSQSQLWNIFIRYSNKRRDTSVSAHIVWGGFYLYLFFLEFQARRLILNDPKSVYLFPNPHRLFRCTE